MVKGSATKIAHGKTSYRLQRKIEKIASTTAHFEEERHPFVMQIADIMCFTCKALAHVRLG
jgi:hypothetical protein